MSQRFHDILTRRPFEASFREGGGDGQRAVSDRGRADGRGARDAGAPTAPERRMRPGGVERRAPKTTSGTAPRLALQLRAAS